MGEYKWYEIYTKKEWFNHQLEWFKKECKNEYARERYKKHPDKAKKYQREYVRNKRNENVNFKLISNCRGRLKDALKGNSKSATTLNLLGCSLESLKLHLQQTAIKNGYLNFDIENYSGKEYHIDHIIPCALFNLKCSYHQKICFNWSNLQILKAKTNISKGKRLL